LLSPIGRQFVEASPPIIRRQAPLARNPSIQFEPLQRRIERALLHPQQIVGQLLDQLRDRVSVQMAAHQYLEYQHVERTRQQVALFFRHSHR
jgi:hypothetical protein